MNPLVILAVLLLLALYLVYAVTNTEQARQELATLFAACVFASIRAVGAVGSAFLVPVVIGIVCIFAGLDTNPQRQTFLPWHVPCQSTAGIAF